MGWSVGLSPFYVVLADGTALPRRRVRLRGRAGPGRSAIPASTRIASMTTYTKHAQKHIYTCRHARITWRRYLRAGIQNIAGSRLFWGTHEDFRCVLPLKMPPWHKLTHV